jgi:hypothetical protein
MKQDILCTNCSAVMGHYNGDNAAPISVLCGSCAPLGLNPGAVPNVMELMPYQIKAAVLAMTAEVRAAAGAADVVIKVKG